MRNVVWGSAVSHLPPPHLHQRRKGTRGRSWLRPQNRIYKKGRRKRIVSTDAKGKVGDLVFGREKMGWPSMFSLNRWGLAGHRTWSYSVCSRPLPSVSGRWALETVSGWGDRWQWRATAQRRSVLMALFTTPCPKPVLVYGFLCLEFRFGKVFSYDIETSLTGMGFIQ